MAKGGRSLFSVTTVFASFFGAALIAGAFAYFNYKFSEYKFIDFGEWVFYEKSDIFRPADDKYIVVLYSSKDKNTQDVISNVNAPYKVIAIDFYQNSFENTKNTIFLRSGTNTNLKFIQRFNIYHSPSIFIIKKIKDTLYKQDSMIRELDTLEQIDKKIKEL
ncbi:hypothetical protein [Sulfurimonas sp. HSL-1716]|uniref:hypothetical protein n=1 Tax=Hydrocurvibacter sulfurireducens TaxID=3131937 RepID=UPI0031FA2931